MHNTKRGKTLANKSQTQMIPTFLWEGFGDRKKTANLHFHFLTILKLLIVRNCNINIKLHIGLLPAAFLHKPPQYPNYPNLLFLFCKGFLSFHLPPFLTNICVDITIKKTCLLILRDSSPESMCSLASPRGVSCFLGFQPSEKSLKAQVLK